jgi:hypothetical protein
VKRKTDLRIRSPRTKVKTIAQEGLASHPSREEVTLTLVQGLSSSLPITNRVPIMQSVETTLTVSTSETALEAKQPTTNLRMMNSISTLGSQPKKNRSRM